jgi:hypothetical protein
MPIVKWEPFREKTTMDFDLGELPLPEFEEKAIKTDRKRKRRSYLC